MQALAARGPGPLNGWARFVPRAVAPSLLFLAACSAFADDLLSMPYGSAAAYAANGRSRLELSSSSLPLYESADGATRSSRIDMIWLPPRHPSLGLALGLTSINGPGLKTFGGSNPPVVDLGFQWRYALDSQYRLDVTAWKRMAPSDAISLVQNHQPGYGARFEMQVASLPSSGFVAERGFLGLQLESGARITVRRTGGRPMLYYRSRF
jgi:hypothetical protein